MYTNTGRIKELREEYESGKSLAEIAVDYNLSYPSLKNYASKNKWKKGITKNIAAAERILDNDEEIRKKKNEFIEKVQDEAINLVETFKENDCMDKDTQGAMKSRAGALETIVNIGSKIFSIENNSEIVARKINQLAYNKQLELLEYEVEIEKVSLKASKNKIKIEKENLEIKKVTTGYNKLKNEEDVHIG